MEQNDQSKVHFAQGWFEEQQRYWSKWAARSEDAEAFCAAEQAWTDACERWWTNVGAALPPPLDEALQGALEQTRICMALARAEAKARGHGDRIESGDDHERLMRRLLESWVQTVSRVATGMTCSPDPAYADAYRALVVQLSDVACAALEAVRERLRAEPECSPRRLYELYVAQIEKCYRAQAASEPFSRAVGRLLNAQIQSIAARSADQSQA